ncbi:MAG: plasmid mobilization relaxosome protein MobC [Microcystaceae cyanobacterium]
MTYDKRLEFRLSSSEKQQLQKEAGQNCTISELVRKKLLKTPTRRERQKNKDIESELKRMGNNLNQIARVLNSIALSQSPLSATVLIDVKGDVQTAISEVRTLQAQFSSK